MESSLTVVDKNERDITSKIFEICQRKDNTRYVKLLLKELHEIRITNSGDVRRYKLCTPPFFAFGAFGIVFGLNDFTKAGSEMSGLDMRYILKVDCSETTGKTLRTAITLNDTFDGYREQYQDNIALSYGKVETRRGDTFAIYKYLGLDLVSILFGDVFVFPTFLFPPGENLDDGWKFIKKTIFDVISCIDRFTRDSFIHGDVCIENMVYDPVTGKISLIDLDGVTNLAKISKSPTCIMHQFPKHPYEVKICATTDPTTCLTYKRRFGRLLTPTLHQLLGIELPKKEVETTIDTPTLIAKLKKVDNFGLFWVITTILMAANNIIPDDIDKLLGIKVGVSEGEIEKSYNEFYSKIFCYTPGNTQGIDDIVGIISGNLPKGDDLVTDFVRETLKLICSDSQLESKDSVEALLSHPFLAGDKTTSKRVDQHINTAIALVTVRLKELIDKITILIDNFMKSKTQQNVDLIFDGKEYTELDKLLKTPIFEHIRYNNLEYMAEIHRPFIKNLKEASEVSIDSAAGGASKKKNKKSYRNTKKRNNRNKQNRTKKAKSRRTRQ